MLCRRTAAPVCQRGSGAVSVITRPVDLAQSWGQANAVFAAIEGLCNPRRRHSTLSNLSPTHPHPRSRGPSTPFSRRCTAQASLLLPKTVQGMLPAEAMETAYREALTRSGLLADPMFSRHRPIRRLGRWKGLNGSCLRVTNRPPVGMRRALGDTVAMTTLSDIYPPFELRVRSGDLELRVVRDEDIPELVELASVGIHDPEVMPFLFPWTDVPLAELGLSMAQHYWRSRAENTADEWLLECAVRQRGELLGIQALSTRHFPVTRTGETGSWLSRHHQGQGIGTRMRRAMCMFAFDHLGFEELTSSAFADNAGSRAVSRKLGYRTNGLFRRQRRDGELALLEMLVLEPGDLIRDGTRIDVEGVTELRRFLALDVRR